MRRTAALLALMPLLLAPRPARAAWHIGPNFGFTYMTPRRGDSLALFNWGSGSAVFGFWQPGMRVGWSVGGDRNEIYTATGLEFWSGGGTSVHALLGSLNYQRNFAPADQDGAFLTGGVGIMNVGGDSNSASVPILGGGAGFLHPVAAGRGRLRAEVRYDYQGEDTTQGLESAHLVTLRIGFDLLP